MRRVILFLFVVALMLMMLAPAALGHFAAPCTDSGGPGNSDYATHNIVEEAKAGLLGAGAHIPGAHKGFSVCNPSGG
jgi:hypothetical protein